MEWAAPKCWSKYAALEECNADGASLAGTGMGFWLTGKLGCAWVGASVVHGVVVGPDHWESPGWDN